MAAADVLSDPLASRAVASTIKVMSPEYPAGVVRVKPLRPSGVKDQVPSPLSVPAENTKPSGTLLMVIDRVSEPSVSVNDAARSMAMTAPSTPSASAALTSGASATASMSTEAVVLITAVPSLIP